VTGLVAAVVWSAAWTFLIVKALAATLGARISSEQEREGLAGERNGDGIQIFGELPSEDLIRS
jgi:ammonia channel protein AmtB